MEADTLIAQDATGQIAGFLDELAASGLTPAAAAAARQSLIDWFAVGLGARGDSEAMELAGTVHAWRSQGKAVAFDGTSGAAAPIALINGTFAHVLDFDDFHIGSVIHAGGPTFAAALALGMDRGAGGDAMLRAFVAGFEVSTRFGMDGAGLALAEAGWHPTGVLGHVAAAVSSASLLGMDRDTLGRTLGLSLAQAGGLMANAGTIAKPLLVGKSAFNGILAADLAMRGIAAPTLHEGEKSLLATMLQRPSAADLSTLGSVWETVTNTFKPYSSCQLTHAPIDAALMVRDRVEPAAVEAVRITVNPFAPKIAGRERPQTPLEAKFSIKHCVAMALSGRGAAPGDFSEANLASIEVTGLREKIELTTDEAVARTSARIEVRMQGREPVTATLPAALGSLERPMSEGDTDAKFMAAAAWMPERDAATLLAALKVFDTSGAPEEVGAILAHSQAHQPPR